MKTAVSILAGVLILLAGLVSTPAYGNNYPHRTTFTNQTDTWVWITPYDKSNDHSGSAFCIGPGQQMTKDYFRTTSLRFEFTSSSGCSHPLRKDLSRPFNAIVWFYLKGNKNSGYRTEEYACHGTTCTAN